MISISWRATCAILVMGTTIASAQPEPAKCPDGLVEVGVLDGNAERSGGEAKLNQPGLLYIPNDIFIDQFYHQQSGSRLAGGSAWAVMTYSDMPGGVGMTAAGDEGGSCVGWSVGVPEIVRAEDGRRAIKVRLYCHTGSSNNCMTSWTTSCAVSARLCLKAAVDYDPLPPPRGDGREQQNPERIWQRFGR